MTTNLITVIVPVFNQVHFTNRCLQSLLNHSQLTRTVIVIDNASTDATPTELIGWKNLFESQGWSFILLRNELNQGFGRACNQGIRLSITPFVTILNNDTWLMPLWDQKLLDGLTKNSADVVGPYFDETSFEDSQMIERAKAFIAKNKDRSIPEFVSVLMFFRRESLQRLGLFDERFFVTYEDADLKHRMHLAKMKYLQLGNCYIWHFSKGTRGSQTIPSNYEQEGLRLFQDKWGFDPRSLEYTRLARLKRRWKKCRRHFGYL